MESASPRDETQVPSKHTEGPFRFVQADRWPFELAIYAGNPDGPLISVPIPAHTSSDMTQEEALTAANFPAKERAHAAGMNAEMVANFRLWAAAPDLLRACQAALDATEAAYDWDMPDSRRFELEERASGLLRAAISKATREPDTRGEASTPDY